MVVPPLTKAVLRQMLRSRRKDHVARIGEAACAAAAVAAATNAMLLLGDASTIAVYASIGSEIGTAPLAARLTAAGKRIALPHIGPGEASMRFLLWTPGTPLVAGRGGICQPPADAPEIVPDVIVAPLLGFDDARNRLGQGGGHYDRAFARNPDARRIGLAWSVQQCERIACDPWDIPLDAIATEKECVT